MNPTDWLNAGYKRYEIPANSVMYNLVDFILQKSIKDYCITVYVYDRSKYQDYPEAYTEQYGFMPTAHYSLGEDAPFFEVTMNGTFTVEECETGFEKLWNAFQGNGK